MWYFPGLGSDARATYKQKFVLQYTGTVITTSTEAAYKAEIENQLSSVQSDLQAQCSNNMVVIKVPVVVLSPTVTFVTVGGKVCITVVASLSCLAIVDNICYDETMIYINIQIQKCKYNDYLINHATYVCLHVNLNHLLFQSETIETYIV